MIKKLLQMNKINNPGQCKCDLFHKILLDMMTLSLSCIFRYARHFVICRN